MASTPVPPLTPRVASISAQVGRMPLSASSADRRCRDPYSGVSVSAGAAHSQTPKCLSRLCTDEGLSLIGTQFHKDVCFQWVLIALVLKVESQELTDKLQLTHTLRPYRVRMVYQCHYRGLPRLTGGTPMNPAITHLSSDSRTSMRLRVQPHFLVKPRLLTLG